MLSFISGISAIPDRSFILGTAVKGTPCKFRTAETTFDEDTVWLSIHKPFGIKCRNICPHSCLYNHLPSLRFISVITLEISASTQIAFSSISEGISACPLLMQM